MIHYNGYVGNTIRYQDTCIDKYAVSIAYAYSSEVVNNSLVEWTSMAHKSGHGDLVGTYPSIHYYYEIIIPFLEHHNIIVNWIDCNYTWGTFDNETGTIGVLGQVYTCTPCPENKPKMPYSRDAFPRDLRERQERETGEKDKRERLARFKRCSYDEGRF